MRRTTADAPLSIEARLRQGPTLRTVYQGGRRLSMSFCSQRAGLRRSPCLRLPSMGHASARERLVTPLCPGPASPSAPACYLAVRTPFYPMVGHHDRKVGVAAMGGQTLQRIRFFIWLLWGPFLLVFVGVIGGPIVCFAFRDAHVWAGSGTAV